MTTQLNQKDRNIITGTIGVLVVVAGLLIWGYFTNQRKATEPDSLAVDLAKTVAAAVKQPAAQPAPAK